MITLDIGDFASKLSTQETWSFIIGFAVGLLYYLVSFTYLNDAGIHLLIPSALHAALILVAFGLMGTALVYIIATTITLSIKWATKNRIKDKNAGLQKLDINEPSLKQQTILLENVLSQYTSLMHFLSLLIGALLILLPCIWLYGSSFLSQYWCKSGWVLACVAITAIDLIGLCLFMYFLYGLTIDYLKYVDLFNKHKIRITFSKKEYADSINAMVG